MDMPLDMPMVDLGVLPCRLDAGIAHRAAIGLLVLATDETMEHEFRHLVRQDGVALYEARLWNDYNVTPETLRAMGERIAPTTALILPGAKLDVVAFGCSSASMTLGEDEVFRLIHLVRPGVACTTPVTAAFAAFKALGAQRIGVLTPYSAQVNEVVRAYLTQRGPTVAAFGTFDKPDDREAARIAPASIAEGIRALARSTTLDAVFVCCTSLRLSEFVADVEKEIGIPVISSDHAMAWHSLRLAGVKDVVPGAGRLFTR
ncbi:MAG TPA: aspartate/glutamate racemase family protein [Acetobacteraceae bacterium]|jgi:maleate isomerase|nr:aspartate/glutamate racemase family protein [Acetobacteraceae bacterium]